MTTIEPTTEAVVWDLDGTILDSFGLWRILMAQVATDFGMPVPTDETLFENYHGELDHSIRNTFGAALAPGQDRAVIDYFNQIQADQDHYGRPEELLWEDALDLAQRISERGLVQILVTNRNHAGQGNASPRSIVGATVLQDHIHEIICGDESPVRKPDPGVLGTQLERRNIAAENTVIIGDQYVDAKLALKMGSKGILVVRDGGAVAHAHELGDGWEDQISVVQSLRDVTV